MVLEIYTDGGSSGNPGRAASACVFYLNKELIYKHAVGIGNATNNFAEYTALIHALRHVKELLLQNKYQLSSIQVHSDSELMVRQITGIYKIKNEDIKALIQQVTSLQSDISIPITYTHIPREQNKVADSLVRSILYS